MKNILFVDDELKVLHGLKRMLRGQREKWDMTFVDSGQAALDEMASASFDVIVTDMRMSGMDGPALLARVQEQHPAVVRIVLSGHAELEAAMRAIPVTHQFLSKPCDSDNIIAVVERACNLVTLLQHEDVRRSVGEIETLPAIPRVYQQLNYALANPDASLDDIADIVEQDLGISAKVLQLVNSSFFGLGAHVASIRQATAYLGINVLRTLVLSMEVYSEVGNNRNIFSIEEEQAHGMLTARIASRLLSDPRVSEMAFMAGVLHDLGKLILTTTMPEVYEHAVTEAAKSSRPLHVVEEEENDISHAEVGGYLLGIWGVPYPIVEAVANHHRPSRVEKTTSFDALGAVHVANVFARDLRETSETSALLDSVYLETIGAVDDLPAWRNIAAEVVASFP